MLTRRRLLAVCAAAWLGGRRAARAQDWPQRPVRIIVPFGPGGGADIIGRIVAQALQDKLGQPVVIENRPGAAGTLGNEAVARADKDGYTLGIMTAGQIIAAVMNKSLRYDTLTAFDPVSQVATAGLIIVTRPDFPADDVKQLVAAAKANPGKLSFASPGFGATQHFTGELFRQTADINILHVPFRTSPEAISAVLGKQVDVLFDTISAVLGQVQSGQLKALAVTGKDRFPAVPDVPAAIESGVLSGYDVTGDHRQAQQSHQRKPRGGGRAKALDHGRRGRARLDAGGLRRARGARVRPLERGARGRRHSAAVNQLLRTKFEATSLPIAIR